MDTFILPLTRQVFHKQVRRRAFNPQEVAATKAVSGCEPAVTSTQDMGWGEIEIIFSPIKRE